MRDNRFNKNTERINNQIRVPSVRVVDEEGGQIGVLSTREALQMAYDQGIDLVEISPNANPPVCKLIDYGKFKYQQKKKTQEAKKHQTVIQLKEIKLRPKTDIHDFEVKVRHIREFLQEAKKVKVTIWFKGREIMYKEKGTEMLTKVVELTKDVGAIEQPIKMEGRNMILLLGPAKN